MKLTTNDQTVALVSCRPTTDGCVLVTAELVTPGATLVITTDDGAELRRYIVADWLRCEVDGCTLTLSDSPAPEPVPVGLDALRAARQAQNKQALADWLAAHPLPWTDGNVYGVTEQDQNEMAINLAQYQLAVAADQPAVLEWHAQKQQCHTFTIEDYTALSLAIAAYVYPYRRYQETVKEAIFAAQSEEELDAIEIDYGSVGAAA